LAAVRQLKDAAMREATTDKVAAALIKESDETTADAGIKAAKDSPRRLDAAKKLLADMGGEMKQFYMVMGDSTLSEFAKRRMMR
jgi:hypothetical protein